MSGNRPILHIDLSVGNLSVTANIVAEFYSNSIREGSDTEEIIENGQETVDYSSPHISSSSR